MDGTLVDSSKGIYNALTLACKANNCNVPKFEHLKQVIGPPINTIVDRICKEASLNERQEICKSFRQYYDSKYYCEVEWYETTIDTLVELKVKNHELFVVTNKTTAPSVKIIEDANIIEMFGGILGIDYRSVNKTGNSFSQKSDAIEHLLIEKDLDRKECIYIGDTLGDKEACNISNIKFIGANYGFHEWTSKDKMFVTCISSFREILSHIE